MHSASPHRRLRFIPRLEPVEPRLPLGDALLGLWALGIGFDSAVVDPKSITLPALESETWVAGAEQREAPAERPDLCSSRRGVEDSAPATVALEYVASRPESVATWPQTAATVSHNRQHGSIASNQSLATRPVVSTLVSGDAATRPSSFLNSGLGTPVRETPAIPKTDLPVGAFPKTSSETSDRADSAQVQERYGQMPLAFEANHGQTDSRVDFIARMGGATVFLTSTSAVFSVSASRVASAPGGPFAGDELRVLTQPGSPEEIMSAAVHMEIVGGNPNATSAAQDQLPGIVNYFIGNDPSQWHTDIPTFGRVEYQDVYPGIDLAYYGNQSPDREGAGLEYDFIVSPGADPNAITLNFAGAKSAEINPDGDLVLHTAAGDVVQQRPFTYQEVGAERQEIASRYEVDGTQVRFDVGAYDASRPLVIDPLVLGYSTYLGAGGASDYVYDIAVDQDGYAYVIGDTRSAKFPSTPGAFDETYNDGGYDAFIAKLNDEGSGLVYATFIGGTGEDLGRGITIDAAGNVYASGSTHSRNLPTTPGAFDTSYNRGGDAYIAKLDSDGNSLIYASYLGGSASDVADEVAIDMGGTAYLLGSTRSINFPTTFGAFDPTHNGLVDTFVVAVAADGSTLSYATCLGGSGDDLGGGIIADTLGRTYVVGTTDSLDFPTTAGAFDQSYNGGSYDAFVIILTSDGAALAFSTYLGGENTEGGNDISLDVNGFWYIAGRTLSDDFPTTPGAFDTVHAPSDVSDGFVTKFNRDGVGLVYSTYLSGGSSGAQAIAVDTDGNAYVSGTTFSDFATTPGAFDQTYNGGGGDAFLLVLNSTGSNLNYSTYLGGSNSDQGWGIAVDGGGSVYLGGDTRSSNFPTTPNALKGRNRNNLNDAFVSKFADM